jgi:2-keto-4-pentenoate hydratase/2-oxohepta-3-ene-1,7-dioic acid hydratase in catechol pathway
MRWVCAKVDGAVRLGLVERDEAALLPPRYDDLVALIEAGSEAQAAAAAEAGERRLLAGLDLLAPIRRFRRDVLCTGWNYWDHFEEGRGKRGDQEVERPAAPTFFTKGPDAVIGPRDPIGIDPKLSAKWDWEAELAVVIGKAGRSIRPEHAMEHVFGVCLANDVSQRDLQRRHGGQWLKGKSIDGTMPLGPWLTTLDEIDLPNVRLQCFVNGEERQNALVAQMAFPLPELIAELSFGMTLRPGDVIITGTPSGVGHARTPPVFLREGDEVVVTGTGLGELRNRVVPADLAGDSPIRP